MIKKFFDIDVIIQCIYTGSVLYFLYHIYQLNIIPSPFFYMVCGVVFIIYFVSVLCYYKLHKIKGIRYVFRLLNFVVAIGLIVLSSIVGKVNTTISIVSDNHIYEVVNVYVKQDANAQNLEDVKHEVFGYVEDSLVNNAIQDIQNQLQQEVQLQMYEKNLNMVESLWNQSIKVMVMNQAYEQLIIDSYPEFPEQTRKIYTYEHKKDTNVGAVGVNVKKESFNLYISGIDTYGKISSTSRTDVNLLVTVNPKKSEILLTNIPRDYYIEQTCQQNQKDKLTHTGIFGIDCTLSSIERFLDIPISYYLRVNFSSLEKLIDALGGIQVYNDIEFQSFSGITFPSGLIPMDGKKALIFSRERKAFSGGDRQRGKNQMKVIEAVIDKLSSFALIQNYFKVMDALQDSVQTNMTTEEITSFIKMQLNEKKQWKVLQQSLDGTGENGVWSPANQSYSYMMIPDEATVEGAKKEIQRVMNDEGQ